MNDTQFHDMPDGRRIAHRFTPGKGAALVFLPGYKSDMDGGKATALFEWARANGRPCLLLDYSGCGRSSGDFADGTLGCWCDEAMALVEAKGLDRVVLAGSSMGAWLMVLIGLRLGPRLAGMVGIAAAPDFTEWGRSAQDKLRLRSGETVFDDNPYGPEPTPIHPGFYIEAQGHLLLGGSIPIDCPVRLLHGQGDNDVPWDISIRLARALRSDDVQVNLIKDGDHRLSRNQDIALLLGLVDSLLRHTE